jgi:hypothetical protein
MPSGEMNFPGTITIGGDDQGSMSKPMSESEPMREAAKADEATQSK